MLSSIITLIVLLSGSPELTAVVPENVVLASHNFSMESRYGNAYVNDIFKDNILLTMAYMNGKVTSRADLSWNKVEAPFHYELTLNPEEEFAFHDGVLPAYSKNIVKTMGVHFNSTEGFKSDGYLVGDGVCQLASLIYWAAKDAGLTAYAPSNHNFAEIPGVPKEYGVAILAPSPLGNLYIVNSLEKPVSFVFDFDGNYLTVEVIKKVNSPLS